MSGFVLIGAVSMKGFVTANLSISDDARPMFPEFDVRNENVCLFDESISGHQAECSR